MRTCLLQDVEEGLYQPARLRSNQAIFALLSITCLTLFIGFHITLYDSTVYRTQLRQEKLQQQQQQPQQPQQILDISNQQDFTFVNDIAPTVDFLQYENQQSSNVSATKRRSHFPKTQKKLPQALIVGVRKCGTRALLEMMFLHPRVQKAAGEMHFFDRDENYDQGLEWYRQQMPFSSADQVTIEKSPSYFVTPEVPERVRAMNASIRLLLILREPVTRAISDYTQLMTHLASTTPQMRSAIAQKSFEEMAITPDGEVNSSYKPITISMYHTYVLQWLEVFPREQILIVNGDRLIEDPMSEVQKIELFLGLESKVTKDNFYFNQTKGFYCLKTNGSERCLHESKGRKHPRVDATVISKLRKFFNDHNQRLYDLVGEDLGWPDK